MVDIEVFDISHPLSNPPDPDEILNECRTIGFTISEIQSRLKTFGDLNSSHDESGDATAFYLDILNRFRGLIERIKYLRSRPESQWPRNRRQVDQLDRLIHKAVQEYRKSEQQFRRNVDDRQRRHIRTVNPHATEEEVKEAISRAVDTPIFQQALLDPGRRSKAHSAARNARQRGNALKQLEEEMVELQQILQDLDTIVQDQEPMVQSIEQQAVGTQEDMERGNMQLDRAIESARAARKRKQICLGVCVVVCLMMVIVLLIWAAFTGKLGQR